MKALILLIASLPAPECHPKDAFEFGMTYAEVNRTWKLSYCHMDKLPLLAAERGLELPPGWSQDAVWCQECWSALDNLLSTSDPHAVHNQPFLQAQAKRLYNLLGPDLYRSRRLPPPTPEWLFGSPAPTTFIPPSQR
jgi:hypothetical protein